jgi:PTS system mannose-specific IIA component
LSGVPPKAPALAEKHVPTNFKLTGANAMTALLFITHNDIGAVLARTATEIIGHCPFAWQSLSFAHPDDLERSLAEARAKLQELDQGDGVLILTDLYGSSPWNVATHLCSQRHIVVTGVNLAMVLRLFNYSRENLYQLAQLAVDGGIRSIQQCDPGRASTRLVTG